MPLEDMPVFVIKAKDVLSLAILEAYIDLCVSLKLHYQAQQVRSAYNEVARWREANPELVKAPHHPHVPVMKQR